MKIGVLSDTHQGLKNIDEAIPTLKKCDLIIHAGDNFSDSKYINKSTEVDIIAIKGNCDFEHVENELVFEIGKKKIFLTHGDRYNVKYGMDNIEEKAKKINADIVIFGHTHIVYNKQKEGILYLNPGSLSIPRGSNCKSYMILDIEDEIISVEKICL